MAGSFPFFLTVFFHLLMMLSCLQYIHVNAGLKVHQLSDCSAFILSEVTRKSWNCGRRITVGVTEDG